MSKEKSDALFNLIKSLKKSEKRYFRIMVSHDERNGGRKYIRLFDLIDEQPEFDEEGLLKKDSEINPAQLSNL
ncbi:MAG: hypothetical protein WD555_02300, partial [Fulvivirga sp.]